jgi:hypothetical protein
VQYQSVTPIPVHSTIADGRDPLVVVPVTILPSARTVEHTQAPMSGADAGARTMDLQLTKEGPVVNADSARMHLSGDISTPNVRHQSRSVESMPFTVPSVSQGQTPVGPPALLSRPTLISRQIAPVQAVEYSAASHYVSKAHMLPMATAGTCMDDGHAVCVSVEPILESARAIPATTTHSSVLLRDTATPRPMHVSRLPVPVAGTLRSDAVSGVEGGRFLENTSIKPISSATHSIAHEDVHGSVGPTMPSMPVQSFSNRKNSVNEQNFPVNRTMSNARENTVTNRKSGTNEQNATVGPTMTNQPVQSFENRKTRVNEQNVTISPIMSNVTVQSVANRKSGMNERQEGAVLYRPVTHEPIPVVSHAGTHTIDAVLGSTTRAPSVAVEHTTALAAAAAVSPTIVMLRSRTDTVIPMRATVGMVNDTDEVRAASTIASSRKNVYDVRAPTNGRVTVEDHRTQVTLSEAIVVPGPALLVQNDFANQARGDETSGVSVMLPERVDRGSYDATLFGSGHRRLE